MCLWPAAAWGARVPLQKKKLVGDFSGPASDRVMPNKNRFFKPVNFSVKKNKKNGCFPLKETFFLWRLRFSASILFIFDFVEIFGGLCNTKKLLPCVPSVFRQHIFSCIFFSIKFFTGRPENQCQHFVSAKMLHQ